MVYKYKYNIRNSEGEREVIGFNFSPESGRLSSSPDIVSVLVAVGSYRPVPDAGQLSKLLKQAEESEQGFSVETLGGGTARTLLVPVGIPWCESGEHVTQVRSIIIGSQSLALKSAIIQAVELARNSATQSAPIVRGENLAFLWDMFCYFQAHKEMISNDLDTNRTDYTHLIEMFDDEFKRPTPWDIGCWALPVDIFEDLSSTVMRVPYDVMLDLYNSTPPVNPLEYDGAELNKIETPIDITKEFQKMLENRNNRRN